MSERHMMKKIFLSLIFILGISVTVVAEDTVIYSPREIAIAPSVLPYKWLYSEPEYFYNRGYNGNFALKMTAMGVLRLDEKKFAGKIVKFSAMIKAEDIMKQGGGVALQLRIREANGKLICVSHVPESALFGTYDWKKVTTEAEIPADVKEVSIGIGIQGTMGTVYFSEPTILVESMKDKQVRNH